MASKATLRPLSAAARLSTHGAVQCPSRAISAPARQFSTTPVQEPKPLPDPIDVPRWKQTPKAMVAPVRLRPINPKNLWQVTEDPAALDEVYKRILGEKGHKLLPEEVKWLAVTHKSFDHGRRGHNDRLAFLGRRIVELQTSLALLNLPRSNQKSNFPDPYRREPFMHESLLGVNNITDKAKTHYAGKEKLAQVAYGFGIDKVLRWKPKKADNLQGSGVDAVVATTLYAIIGAVALHRGGVEANRLVKEQILTALRQ